MMGTRYKDLVAVVFLGIITSCSALECFTCSNATAVSECKTTKVCGNGEICFAEHTQTSNDISYTFGCRAETACGAISSATQMPMNMIGRSTSAGPCLECCKEHHCNRHLCQHSFSAMECSDGTELSCVTLDKLLNICSDTQRAITVCRRFCGLCYYTDGDWSSWSAWSNCDVSCGNGTLTRLRTCTSPPPSPDGSPCDGPDHESQTCTLQLCPVHGGWAQWSPWGSCSATCGIGMQRRDRTCSNPLPDRFGDHCFGDSRDDKLCVDAVCPATNGGWSLWSSWTTCSQSCDSGMHTRSRNCDNPKPSIGGEVCSGSSYEISACNVQKCPVIDGGWSTWSAWSTCTTTCNGGFYTRNRDCSNPFPSSGGKLCVGKPYEISACNSQTCPLTNGGWSLWSSWTTCSQSCDFGMRTRIRNCNNPKPSVGGEFCSESPFEVSGCNIQKCPMIDGGWSAWSTWSTCTATCNGGLYHRHRDCNSPFPYAGGKPCVGKPYEISACNTQTCQVTNGGWSLWSSWTACSQTCDSGMHTRSRNCDNPKPSVGGQFCSGNSHETSACYIQECPISHPLESVTAFPIPEHFSHGFGLVTRFPEHFLHAELVTGFPEHWTDRLYEKDPGRGGDPGPDPMDPYYMKNPLDTFSNGINEVQSLNGRREINEDSKENPQ